MKPSEQVRAQAAAVQHLVLDGLFELALADDAAVPEDSSEYGQAAVILVQRASRLPFCRRFRYHPS